MATMMTQAMPTSQSLAVFEILSSMPLPLPSQSTITTSFPVA